MQIGRVTVDSVLDGYMAIGREIEYPDMAASRWEPWVHLLGNDGKDVVNQLGGYLVRSDDYVALIDTGFGPSKVENWHAGELLNSLAALGITPEDITDVFFTHLHFDHIGWASVDGKPVFPHANYRCHVRDWEHFVSVGHAERIEESGFPDEMSAENKLRPIEHLLKTWPGTGEILPGLSAWATPGHSPGTTVIRLDSEGESALFIGDVAHHQAELCEPDWQGVADDDVALARQSRQAVAQSLAETGIPFVAAHFRDFEWGNVIADGSKFGWAQVQETVESK
ncbi:MBL fold metallo-hydrolase [Arthrobacter sp. AZCC_0090]|uniref:MBL fold metallo-hydrolase n=1 Tax=Arthrobacter sp. AZCC_0090 TaxID=2735881 RepID=UPI00161B52EB|nr:MBL fold metallo-hydrolase [Arthrobacter sp. AZCC_0090]MBB6407180.1 glyoxylase-like metal-dependent hydrolase (beta-lactamase superfamily II) [Arthrobacter sp. AZCC_0090]